MKKVLKKISFLLCSFIIGAQSKIFAVGQTTKYGPIPDPNVNPQAKYGVPAPTITRTPSNTTVRSGAGLGHAQILSILAAILLFFIGLIIALSKGIKKNVKIILVTIISILIVLLMILTMFVF